MLAASLGRPRRRFIEDVSTKGDAMTTIPIKIFAVAIVPLSGDTLGVRIVTPNNALELP